MSCCGKGRAVAGTTAAPRRSYSTLPPRPTVTIEYTGDTSLSVIGPGTRTRYYFAVKGAQLAVDLRDRPYLLTIPRLRQVG